MSAPSARRRARRWARWRRGPRLVALITAVAVLALVAGVALSRFVVSPAELAAAARPPAAGPVTAPVEERVIQSTVTSRADVTYADAVDVEVDSTGLTGPAVVTGRVPEVGSTLEAGSVALEVAGRPLIVLPGELPAYRALRSGLSGPDVLQLKAALGSLGLDPGDTASADFDAATASALDELYRRVGYSSPGAGAESAERLDAARSAVRSAEAALEQAGAAVSAAAAGPSIAQRVEADNQVREAQRALEAATAEGSTADGLGIASLQDALALALARRDDLLQPPPLGAERAGLASAEGQLADARAALARAEEEALTTLPASEVVYLSSLPRRVDSVAAERGSVTRGAALSVSGAELVLEGSAAAADAALLSVGATATFEGADGVEHTATVAAVTARGSGDGGAGDSSGAGGGSGGGGTSGSGSGGGGSGGGGSGGGSGGSGSGSERRFDVTLTPSGLTPQEVESLKGSNVRVSIPVESTEGAVLAVPVAALTAGPGGEARIELLEGTPPMSSGDPMPASDGSASSVLVEVTTGLSAGGYVEIRSEDPRVRAGARVVVGR
ncbi:hypothetical protein [Herbiconiux liukaitaii]|uniref:hypothetical protein n=1 Tax=Herbiconiux liukaitaii TaxID=3342799 RepID=UPI0035BB790E